MDAQDRQDIKPKCPPMPNWFYPVHPVHPCSLIDFLDFAPRIFENPGDKAVGCDSSHPHLHKKPAMIIHHPPRHNIARGAMNHTLRNPQRCAYFPRRPQNTALQSCRIVKDHPFLNQSSPAAKFQFASGLAPCGLFHQGFVFGFGLAG